MSKVDRRTVLTGLGIAGLASTGALAVAAQSGGQEDALRRILHRLVGPFSMKDSDFSNFVADFTGGRRILGSAEADVLRLLEVVDPARALVRLHPDVAARMEKFDRELLTEFALATGLAGSPGSRDLEYGGLFRDNPCTNPFARRA